MKLRFYAFISMITLCLGLRAQTWTAPQVPGATLTSVKSTEIVYLYNVDADVFAINGMDWNTNACSTRLTNGDTKIAEPQQCYAFVSGSNVGIRLVAFNTNYISCLSKNAYDIYVDQSQGYQFKFTETASGSNVYTLRNNTYSANLDLAWPTGGHLTLVNGAGATNWAFIPQTSITNGSYARYKAQKQLYAVYEAIVKSGTVSKYSDALATAKAVYDNTSATTAQLQTAATNLFNAASADIEGPLDVSFLMKNADMAGSGNCTGWVSASQSLAWGEFEKYHATITLTQKVTAPEGIYDVQFLAIYRQDGTNAAPTLTATADNTVKVNIPLMDDLDYLVGNTNSNNWTSGNEHPRPDGMQSGAQALCHPDAKAVADNVLVGSGGSITVTARMSSTSQWLNWQGMRLIYKGNGTSSLKQELADVISEANALYGDGHENGAAELKAVIDRAQALYNNSSATAQELIDMKTELQEAMETFKLAAVSIERPIDWSDRLSNRSFEQNFTDWVNSGMATQSNSAFGLKSGNIYAEKWVSAGNPVGDASVTQTVKNLGMGVFILKAVAHNIQEGSSAVQKNAWIIANTSRTEVNKDAEYTLIFTNIENNATICFEAVGATGNWLAVDNFQLYYAGGSFDDFKAELERYVAEAEPHLNKYIQNSVRNTLTTAINNAKAELQKSTADGYPAVATPVRKAIEDAKVSIKAFEALKAAIEKAETAYGDGDKIGADKFLAAINNAKAVYNNLDATQADMSAQIKLLEQAALQYNLDNATGTVPKVTTDKRYVRGAVEAFGRMTVSGVSSSNILEQGFCYSTHPNPTVLDQRSTDYLELNGRIYRMPMEPATVYYIRAYAMTKTYQVGYGNVIKMSTLPMGNVTYTYYNNDGGDFHNTKNNNALTEACWYWSNYTSINGFHVTANYSAGTPTADCGYGGGMRIGPNGGQRTGTVMHEMNHGVGCGTLGIWGGWEVSWLRTSMNGDWAGERANGALRFWENRNDLVICGAYDNAHWGFRPLSGVYEDGGGSTAIWENKYAFNGAHLEPGAWAGPSDWNGTQLVYIGNSIITQGMMEDGLIPVNAWSGGFCLPAYTFEHDDLTKYYIKNENTEFGLYDSYLVEDASGKISWKAIDSSELADHEEAAWYVSFTPRNQYYQVQNAKSKHYISFTGSGFNGFKGMSRTTITNNENFHVIRGRNDVNVGGVKVRGFWLIHPENGPSPSTLTATSTGISSVALNLYDSGSDQRWIFLTADEVASFEQGVKKSLQTDLKDFIAQIRKLEKVPHTEDVEGADQSLESTLRTIEVASATATTMNEVKPLITDAREAAMTYLSQVTPVSPSTPFDLTFMVNNPAIDDNSGWSDNPTFSNSCCEYFERTFDFNQTLNNMPKGTYKLTNQAFQRPGDYTTAYNNFAKGTNNVNAVLYINAKTAKICHIGQYASSTQLHSEDVTVGSPTVYIPNSMVSAAAYFKKGYYANEVLTTMNTQGGTVKIGLRGTVSNSGYWTIFDNFHLYYYGSMSTGTITGIDEMEAEDEAVETDNAVYNVQGQYLGTSIEGLPAGIYIVNGKKILVK